MRFLGRGLFLLALTVTLGACASKDEVTTTTSRTPVAGERRSGDGGVTPGAGPGGASASVKW